MEAVVMAPVRAHLEVFMDRAAARGVSQQAAHLVVPQAVRDCLSCRTPQAQVVVS